MSYEHILVETGDGVGTITMNRPETLNAMIHDLSREVRLALEDLDNRADTRAIILTGAGKAFSAGASLSKDGKNFSRWAERPAAPPEGGILPWEVRKPVIAAINGHAAGMGATWAVMCDMRIMSEEAKLVFPFVRRGVTPELWSTALLPRLVGLARAMELLLTGRPIMGQEAAAIGLVNRAVPRDQVLAQAREMARDIAANSAPNSVELAKAMILEHLGVDMHQVWEREHHALRWSGQHPDSAEGVQAFLERRSPRWHGGLTRETAEDLVPVANRRLVRAPVDTGTGG